jgi:hypothetical protein
MADIFLSYASEDRSRAAKVAGALVAHGWSVWWDRRIVAGQSFDDVIERELKAAKCVVVLWSASSVSSKWVRNECSDANDKGVLVPVLIERVAPPFEFRHVHAADLVDWDGDPSYDGLKSLLDGISAALGSAPAAGPMSPAAAGDRPTDLPLSEPGTARSRPGIKGGIAIMVDRMIVLDRRALQVQFALAVMLVAIGVAVAIFGFLRLGADGSEIHIVVMLAGAVMGLAGLLPFSGCLTRWQRIGTLREIRLSADLLGEVVVSNLIARMYAKSLGV